MVFQTHPGALTQPPACVQISHTHPTSCHAHNVKSMQVRKENRCLKNGHVPVLVGTKSYGKFTVTQGRAMNIRISLS